MLRFAFWAHEFARGRGVRKAECRCGAAANLGLRGNRRTCRLRSVDRRFVAASLVIACARLARGWVRAHWGYMWRVRLVYVGASTRMVAHDGVLHMCLAGAVVRGLVEREQC